MTAGGSGGDAAGTRPDVWICDFAEADDRAAFARLMAEFAAEPVSASAHLGEAHFEKVAGDLARRAGTLVLFASRAEIGHPEGVLIAFEGYSSFAQRPLFNVHDVHVSPEARGKGLGSAMVEALVEIAREHGFAKITLEVAATNAGAVRLYRRLGFKGLDNLPAEGPAGATWFASRGV